MAKGNKMKKNTCIVIPTHNNQEKIGGVLKQALEISNSVIVVDSSTDSTAQEIKKFPQAILIREKPGKGRQLRKGIKKALELECDLIALMDGDGERKAEDFEVLAGVLEAENSDLCIGYRNKMRSLKRSALNAFSKHWINFAAGCSLKDPQSGFCFGKKEAFKKMKLESQNFEIETEIVLEAFRNDLKVSQAPISVPEFSPSKCTKKSMIEINAFFDSWVLEHLNELRVGKTKKALLFIACGLGLLAGKPRQGRKTAITPKGH